MGEPQKACSLLKRTYRPRAGERVAHEHFLRFLQVPPSQAALARTQAELPRRFQYPASHDARHTASVEDRRHQGASALDEQVRHGTADEVLILVLHQSLPNTCIPPFGTGHDGLEAIERLESRKPWIQSQSGRTHTYARGDRALCR